MSFVRIVRQLKRLKARLNLQIEYKQLLRLVKYKKDHE